MSYPLQSLSELGIIQTGCTPPTSELSYWGGDIPFVTPGELEQSQVVVTAPRTLSSLGVERARLLKKDAVMVCCIGSLGKIGIAGRPVVTNQQINSIEFDPEKIWPKYGYYACQRLKSTLVSMAPATTIAIVSKSKFGQLQIPVPTLAEQRHIAAILDQAVSLRAKRRETLAQLDSLTQSIFIEMFEGGDRGEGRWQICTVGDLTDCIVPGRDKPKSFSGGIPWVTTSDLKHLGVTFDSEKGMGLSNQEIETVNARVIPRDSVIISCVGDLGTVTLAGTSMVVNQQLHSFQCHSGLNNVFLMYCLARQKSYMLAKASSTTLPYMNKSVCNSIPVFLPPLELQQAFASRILQIEKIKVCHKVALAEIDKLFSALQQRAFIGEL